MKQSISIQYYKSPVGELILGSLDEKLCLCDWRYRKMRSSIDKRISSLLQADFREEESSVIQEAINQLDLYFKYELQVFTLPLELAGTEFQKQVWDALRQVPYGKTSTYLDLARTIGKESAVRAVASANGANALSIIVPCHRIIGKNGALVGYAGGLSAKERLLALESQSLLQGELFSS